LVSALPLLVLLVLALLALEALLALDALAKAAAVLLTGALVIGSVLPESCGG
jgi:hypothetical protein